MSRHKKLMWLRETTIGFFVVALLLMLAIKIFEWNESFVPEDAARLAYIFAVIGCGLFTIRIFYLVCKK